MRWVSDWGMCAMGMCSPWMIRKENGLFKIDWNLPQKVMLYTLLYS